MTCWRSGSTYEQQVGPDALGVPLAPAAGEEVSPLAPAAGEEVSPLGFSSWPLVAQMTGGTGKPEGW